MKFVLRERCAVCGAGESRVLWSRRFTDPAVWEFLDGYYGGRIEPGELGEAVYEIRRCVRCGFLWQPWILDEAGMETLYTRWIASGETFEKKRRAGARLFAAYARQVQAIAALVPKPPFETRVLDYGAGWGFWCRMAQAHGYDVTGYELSPERARFARTQGIRMVDDLDALGRVDFINTEQVFEHLPDPRATLERLVSHLAPGGVVRISVPNGAGAAEALVRPDFRVAKSAVQPLEHVNCFTFETLVRFAGSCGLRWIDPGTLAPRRRGLRAWVRRLRAGPPRRRTTSQCFRLPAHSAQGS